MHYVCSGGELRIFPFTWGLFPFKVGLFPFISSLFPFNIRLFPFNRGSFPFTHIITNTPSLRANYEGYLLLY
jgi:hypothetical protein